MRKQAKQRRENQTITIDFQNEAIYFQLLGDGKAFLELVMAFILSLGFQLKHKASCSSGGCLTRHSHYLRLRLGGITLWRLQCTSCKAVFTVLPHFVLRYRQMRPEVPRDAFGRVLFNPASGPVSMASAEVALVAFAFLVYFVEPWLVHVLTFSQH